MKFLLVNDDGIQAPGLSSLLETVKPHGKAFVIAPQRERSGASHSITIGHPLRLLETELGFALDGTPVDCVKMGLRGQKWPVDFVLSGINNGPNLGTDALYSGTVAAALEAALLGVPALAFSLCGSSDYLPGASHFIAKLLFGKSTVLKRISELCPAAVLNINIPALPQEDIKGFKITRSAILRYENVMEKRLDHRGNPYYWMGGEPRCLGEPEEDWDLIAVERGYVSITPLRFDFTNYEQIPGLRLALAEDFA